LQIHHLENPWKVLEYDLLVLENFDLGNGRLLMGTFHPMRAPGPK